MPINTALPICVVDLETFDLTGEKIWCAGFTDATGSWCVEWDEQHTPDYIERLATLSTLVFHNAKFDVRVMREHNTTIEPGSYYDTMIMSYVHNPRREGGHSLGSWGHELG